MPPWGRPEADEISLEYLAVVLCGNQPESIWRCLEPLEPPHICRGGRRWFRRSVIVPWIRTHQAEIHHQAERLGAQFPASPELPPPDEATPSP